MTLYITEAQVSDLVGIDDAIAAVENAGRLLAAAQAPFIPRARLRMKNGFLHLMPAALEKDGCFGYKAYTSFKGVARFVVFLFDGSNGGLRAVVEADKLGQLRTGAASGAATRILARKNAESLGLIGSGYQAETQLTAAVAAGNFKTVRVFSRNFDHAEKFCEKMQGAVKPGLEAVRKVEDAASSDVVTTATSAVAPVLFGEMLRPGCHVNAVGGNMLVKRELDEKVVERSNLIVIDSREQGKMECGDFLPLIDKGRLHWSGVCEFGDMFNGRAARKSDEEITLFKSQGIAPWDVALADVVYKRAVERNVGTRIPL